MIKNSFITHALMVALILQISCTGAPQETTTEAENPKAIVKTALVTRGDIEENIQFNGKTVYLRKNSVASPIAGYLTKVHVQLGDKVRKGDPLFEIQTKENKALEHLGINGSGVSPTAGIIQIVAPSDGMISELNALTSGTYVAEGSSLCTVVEDKDIMVLLSIPYESHALAKVNNKCTLSLPDGTLMDGQITKILPTMDETTQTQNVWIKPSKATQIPENLNLMVQFVKAKHQQSLLIAKEALLTNEVQNEFWVMKVSHDSLAIKVPVLKGLENKGMVEVSSPGLSVNDLVIIQGAYGLPDSTVVQKAN